MRLYNKFPLKRRDRTLMAVFPFAQSARFPDLFIGGVLRRNKSVGIDQPFGMRHITAQRNRVPINRLVPIIGTPLADSPVVSAIETARVIATCRIVFPESWVRLSAGREALTEGEQALLLLAGANSIFVGDRLLTTQNPGEHRDQSLLDAFGNDS